MAYLEPLKGDMRETVTGAVVAREPPYGKPRKMATYRWRSFRAATFAVAAISYLGDP